MSRHALTLIELLIVISVIALLIAIFLPAVQMAREGAHRIDCSHRLHQLGVAMNSYSADWEVLPPFSLRTPRSPPPGPWCQHVRLLPYLERRSLYNSFNLELNWLHLANTTVGRFSPDVYLCPSDSLPSVKRFGFVNYHACGGSGLSPDGLDAVKVASRPSDGLFAGRPVKPQECIDGLSHTAAFSELVLPRSMTEPPSSSPSNASRLGYRHGFQVLPATQRRLLQMCEDLSETFRTTSVIVEEIGSPWVHSTRYTHLAAPGGPSCFGQNIGDVFSPITASSRHPSGVNVLFADGHVKFIGENVDLAVWRAAGSRNGQEHLDGQF